MCTWSLASGAKQEVMITGEEILIPVQFEPLSQASGSYVPFKSLPHIWDSVAIFCKTPAYWDNYREPWCLGADGILWAEEEEKAYPLGCVEYGEGRALYPQGRESLGGAHEGWG